MGSPDEDDRGEDHHHLVVDRHSGDNITPSILYGEDWGRVQGENEEGDNAITVLIANSY